ncbi:MAG: sigma-70 family RNA polymerase sigma factor [Thermoleophilaceae bacterium]
MLSTRRQRQGRPTRAEIDPAALDLISRFGPQILGTARRYSLNADDAEDAYQRGLEILLTKAPTTRSDELVPWLKTVVKHEAFAIRRQRERAAPVAGDEGMLDREAHGQDTGEHAERYERLRLGAEALGRLKPQEVRCLLLRAEGYSYKQICEVTGWTYTKVNRCLTEGRAAFLERLDGIQSGAECERLAPHLSALADGEASASDMAALRPHLRSCLSCRATLREFRAAPQRVAALVPAAAIGAGPAGTPGWLDSLLGWAGDRTASLTLKAQSAVEIVSAQKVAAVAASTAVLAGGGVATIKTIDPGRAAEPGDERMERPADVAGPSRAAAPVRVPVAPARPPGPRRAQPRAAEARRERRRAAPRPPRDDALSPEAAEFDPTGDPTGAAPSPPPTPAPPAGAGGGTDPQPSPAEAEFGL